MPGDTPPDLSPAAVERLAARVSAAPLYEGHGEESDTPEEAADTLLALSRRAEAMERALREWLDADRDLRAHPPNDTTKAWERKMQRIEAAIATAALVADGGAMPADDDALKIARRLTPAQRRALLSPPNNPDLAVRGTRALATLDAPNAHRGRALAYAHGVTPFWSISSLGRRVRAELERIGRGNAAR
jgi:hypothetical protein